ncbi:MAG: hypothetical protein ACK5PQ_01355 [Alphaproteobacteria bacterium]
MWACTFIFSIFFLPLAASILSLDLGADQWVVDLADHDDIYAVSHLAKDPQLSFVSSQAQSLRTHKGSPEILFHPSLKMVIGYAPISPLIEKICKDRKIKLVTLSYPQSLQELEQQVHLFSRLFPCSRKPETWLQDLKLSQKTPRATAVFWGRAGLCPGGSTLLNDLLKTTPYENLYEKKKGWTYNSLESLIQPSLVAVFFLDPAAPHPLWSLLEKKGIRLQILPHKLTLSPYPPALIELIKMINTSGTTS